MYGLITVMPILRYDPYYGPLSRSTWLLYAGMKYVSLKVLFKFRRSIFSGSRRILFYRSLERYRGVLLGGAEKAAKVMVSKRSSDIKGPRALCMFCPRSPTDL